MNTWTLAAEARTGWDLWAQPTATMVAAALALTAAWITFRSANKKIEADNTNTLKQIEASNQNTIRQIEASDKNALQDRQATRHQKIVERLEDQYAEFIEAAQVLFDVSYTDAAENMGMDDHVPTKYTPQEAETKIMAAHAKIQASTHCRIHAEIRDFYGAIRALGSRIENEGYSGNFGNWAEAISKYGDELNKITDAMRRDLSRYTTDLDATNQLPTPQTENTSGTTDPKSTETP